jgi:hypothetical protein
MNLTYVRSALVPAALAIGLALMLAISACGGSDDGGDGDGGSAKASSDGGAIVAPEGRSPDEQPIYAAYNDLVEGIFGDDPKAACAALTPAAQKEFDELAKKSKGCPAGIAQLFAPDKKPVRPRILKVRVSGAKAIAQVRAGKSKVYSVPFAEQGGNWKVSGLLAGD